MKTTLDKETFHRTLLVHLGAFCDADRAGDQAAKEEARAALDRLTGTARQLAEIVEYAPSICPGCAATVPWYRGDGEGRCKSCAEAATREQIRDEERVKLLAQLKTGDGWPGATLFGHAMTLPAPAQIEEVDGVAPLGVVPGGIDIGGES